MFLFVTCQISLAAKFLAFFIQNVLITHIS